MTKGKIGRAYIYANIPTVENFDALVKPQEINEDTDLLIADWTNGDNPTMFAYQAQKIKKAHRKDIVKCMFKYTSDFDKN